MKNSPPINELDKYRPKVKSKEILSFIINHPGLTVFMVYATIAGFIYLITFYAHFDLQVTVYLEITDILVAGIKDPLVMLMVAGAFSMVLVVWAVVYIQAPFSAWLEKKFSKGFFKFLPYIAGFKGARSFWITAFVILLIYFYMFIGLHSKNKAELILKNKHDLVQVNAEATENDNSEFSLLGTSMNYVFLYNHTKQHALIIPIENVRSIVPLTMVPLNEVLEK